MSSPAVNKAVPDAREYYPLNEPAIGVPRTSNAQTPLLFEPLTLREVTFKNRIWVAAMCQYSSDDGHATDWHLVHLGALATRGTGAITMEATAVVPEGRITPEDAGLWKDSQIEPLRRVVSFAHAHDTKIGVQLSHAGRKSSTHAPWVQRKLGKGAPYVAGKEENGWPDEVFAPSDVSFQKGRYPDPQEMSEAYINQIIDAFLESARRADEAGFDFIELHAAHGYLLHEFLSPLSNVRGDKWGGQSLENRLRLTLLIAEKLRAAWPSHKPLFVRISATDWAEGPERDENGKWLQWGIEQSTILSEKLGNLGVDFINCSTGGNWVAQKIPVFPGYQVSFASDIKKALPNVLVGAVGIINEPEQAESYLQEGKADVILMAREFLRNPSWPLYAAQRLGVTLKPANQFEWAWPAPAPASKILA
ncbi:NADH:flavin oxidoreductase/NADH oxidase [Macrolepiota fuliginosa MF-IS2]|uniref:NADH:flavin oxidoreductase/NADH oxidase n=1 Tax=Macrolepiota fuliginosa MF-IS2 TaxID=1400762 RepID=A0A9P6C2L0_9AGAR|nr:NADH:flavin oxidoreductase/NADH oxidase [Macrolepiota fuliginosa MF-IS2]